MTRFIKSPLLTINHYDCLVKFPIRCFNISMELSTTTLKQIRSIFREEVTTQTNPIKQDVHSLKQDVHSLKQDISSHRQETKKGFKELKKNVSPASKSPCNLPHTILSYNH